jgi:hypothetical protein
MDQHPHDPLSAAVAWLDAQPPDVQYHLALFVMMHIHGVGLFEKTQDCVAALREWLLADGQGDQMVTTGKAVMFRALVNFSCRHFFTKKGWDAIEAHNAALRERAAAKGQENIVNLVTRMLQEKPFRAALWLKAARSWEELCAGVLSDAALERSRCRLSVERKPRQT